MVKITKENQKFIFEVLGMHKLWAFKSQLEIPVEDILDAYQNPEELKEWRGWRAPGTALPFVITAGTYHLEGKKVFWDVTNKAKTIIIKLKDQDYEKLVIDVENPTEAISLLKGAESIV